MLAYLDQKKLSSEDSMRYFQDVLSKLDLSSGREIGTQLGFSPKYFDAMYAIGVKYYDNNRLEDAIKILYQLTVVQPSASRNYKALGACLQAKEDYATAITVYGSAVALAAMDAEIHFYVGQCQFLMGDFSQASITLKLASRLCEKYPDKWAHIAHHAKDLCARATQRAGKEPT